MTAVLEPTTPDRVTDLVELYRGDRDRLVRYAAKFAGGRDQGEDAVQEAFMKLLTNPAEVRNAAAFVTSQARFRGQDESVHRGRQTPVGEAMDWQPDTAPPAEDLDTLPACMGDSAVAAKVEEALQTLTPDQQQCVRMYCLDGKMPKQIGAELGIPRETAYSRVIAGFVSLERLGFKYDEDEKAMTLVEPAAPVAARSSSFPTVEELTATLDLEHPGEWLGPVPAHETLRRVHGSCSAKRAALAQQAHNAPLTPPMRIRAGSGPDSRAAADAELVATLDREFPGRTVTIAEAEQTLRRIHTTCSLGRARQARTQHNAKLPAPEGVSTDTPSTKSISAPTGAEIKKASPTVGTAVTAAPATCTVVTPVVAEVWLMGAKPPISCLLVNTDETTGTRDLAAVSMPGAQREITGQLIGEGYRPDGPWVDIDPAGPEAMRKFQVST